VVLDRLERIDQHGDRQYMSLGMSMGRVHTALHRLRRDSAPYCKVDDPISSDAGMVDSRMRLSGRTKGPLPESRDGRNQQQVFEW
jgi:hypothetical protein